jgi:hypothetical protein
VLLGANQYGESVAVELTPLRWIRAASIWCGRPRDRVFAEIVAPLERKPCGIITSLG